MVLQGLLANIHLVLYADCLMLLLIQCYAEGGTFHVDG